MNNIITKSAAGVEQPDGRRDLAAALGHLFAGGDIRRKSWGQHSYVTTVFTPPITDCVGGDPLLALVRANGDHLPGWVFSQQDIFALDWELLPRQEPAQTAQSEGEGDSIMLGIGFGGLRPLTLQEQEAGRAG